MNQNFQNEILFRLNSKEWEEDIANKVYKKLKQKKIIKKLKVAIIFIFVSIMIYLYYKDFQEKEIFYTLYESYLYSIFNY